MILLQVLNTQNNPFDISTNPIRLNPINGLIWLEQNKSNLTKTIWFDSNFPIWSKIRICPPPLPLIQPKIWFDPKYDSNQHIRFNTKTTFHYLIRLHLTGITWSFYHPFFDQWDLTISQTPPISKIYFRYLILTRAPDYKPEMVPQFDLLSIWKNESKIPSNILELIVS